MAGSAIGILTLSPSGDHPLSGMRSCRRTPPAGRPWVSCSSLGCTRLTRRKCPSTPYLCVDARTATRSTSELSDMGRQDHGDSRTVGLAGRFATRPGSRTQRNRALLCEAKDGGNQRLLVSVLLEAMRVVVDSELSKTCTAMGAYPDCRITAMAVRSEVHTSGPGTVRCNSSCPSGLMVSWGWNSWRR